jgi:hypothetical protein
MKTALRRILSGCLGVIGISCISSNIVFACSIAEEGMPYFKELHETINLFFLTSAVLFSATFLLFLFNVIFKRHGKLSSIGFIIEFLSIPLIFSFAYAAARDGFCGYEETYKISLFGLIFISIMFIFQLGLCLSPLIKRKMR